MVLTTQKPTQGSRQGEVPEGLPGSTLERGMRLKGSVENLGDPLSSSREVGRANETKVARRLGGSQIRSEVLRGRESRLQGEGADRSAQPAQETWAG